MSESKSFAQRQRESRGEKISSCPYCENTVEVYETPEGLIDCYRCGARPVKCQMVPKPGTNEVMYIKAEEASVSQMVDDMLREDQKKGEPGGGSKSSKGREKPKKKPDRRVEQDFFADRPESNRPNIKWLKKTQRKIFVVPTWCYRSLQNKSREWESMGRKGTMSNMVRSVLTAKNLTEIDSVSTFLRDEPKESIPMRCTTDEVELLDSKIRVNRLINKEDLTYGEVLCALLEKFLFE